MRVQVTIPYKLTLNSLDTGVVPSLSSVIPQSLPDLLTYSNIYQKVSGSKQTTTCPMRQLSLTTAGSLMHWRFKQLLPSSQ